MIESIRSAGLLRPLWVAALSAEDEAAGRLTVISGGRRLAALRALGFEAAPTLRPDPPEPRLEGWLRLALTDNLERGFNPAETALAWRLARELLPPGRTAEAAAALGLERSERRREAAEAAASWPPEALTALAEDRLDPEDAWALKDRSAAERDAALSFFLRARPSRRHRRLWLEWLDDLRRRDGTDVATLLAEPELAALEGPAAEKMARRLLYGRRFPYLARQAERRRRLTADLALPPGLGLELDPELEDQSFTVKLTCAEPEELGALAAAAGRLAADPKFRALWRDERGESDGLDESVALTGPAKTSSPTG
ncbi:MAG: ParB N-terminal domain-containing protein [Deltaproteobacteria bacterium]|nr:ParB N-terminal domain-containing protein [Deltaproteobacteria bacterium]